MVELARGGGDLDRWGAGVFVRLVVRGRWRGDGGGPTRRRERAGVKRVAQHFRTPARDGPASATMGQNHAQPALPRLTAYPIRQLLPGAY